MAVVEGQSWVRLYKKHPSWLTGGVPSRQHRGSGKCAADDRITGSELVAGEAQMRDERLRLCGTDLLPHQLGFQHQHSRLFPDHALIQHCGPGADRVNVRLVVVGHASFFAGGWRFLLAEVALLLGDRATGNQ